MFFVHEMSLWLPSLDLLMKKIVCPNQAEGSIGHDLQVLPSRKTIQDLADHYSINKLMDEFSNVKSRILLRMPPPDMLFDSGHR